MAHTLYDGYKDLNDWLIVKAKRSKACSVEPENAG